MNAKKLCKKNAIKSNERAWMTFPNAIKVVSIKRARRLRRQKALLKHGKFRKGKYRSVITNEFHLDIGKMTFLAVQLLRRCARAKLIARLLVLAIASHMYPEQFLNLRAELQRKE